MDRIKKAIKLSIKDMERREEEYYKEMEGFLRERYNKLQADEKLMVLKANSEQKIAQHKANVSINTPDREITALRVANMNNYDLYHAMLDMNNGDVEGGFSKEGLFEYSIMRFELDTRLNEAGFFGKL